MPVVINVCFVKFIFEWLFVEPFFCSKLADF